VTAPHRAQAELPGGDPASAENLAVLYRVLLDADSRGDAAALARIGWLLFSLASTAQQAQRDSADLMNELRAAARAAVAGQGSPASIALLHHVLARHGWLPPPGLTPLQLLAAPPAVTGYEHC
jgi:hypothetical protein